MDEEPERVVNEAQLISRYGNAIRLRQLYLDERERVLEELRGPQILTRPLSLVNSAKLSVRQNIDYFMAQSDPFKELPTELLALIYQSDGRFQNPPYLRMFVNNMSSKLNIKLNDYGNMSWTEDQLEETCSLIGNRVISITELRITNPWPNWNMYGECNRPGFNCELIKPLLQTMPNLEILELTGGFNLNDSFMETLGNCCLNLREFKTDYFICHSELITLVDNCTKLEKLLVCPIALEDVAYALKKLKSLTHLQSYPFSAVELIEAYQSDAPVQLVVPFLTINQDVSRETVQKIMKTFPNARDSLEITGDITDLSTLVEIGGFKEILVQPVGYFKPGQSPFFHTIIMNSASTLTALDIYDIYDGDHAGVVVDLGMICKTCTLLTDLRVCTAYFCDDAADFSGVNLKLQTLEIYAPEVTKIPDELLFRLLSNMASQEPTITDDAYQVLTLENVPVPDHVMERVVEDVKERSTFFLFYCVSISHISAEALVSFLCQCGSDVTLIFKKYDIYHQQLMSFITGHFHGVSGCLIKEPSENAM